MENRATSCHSLQVSQCQEEVASLKTQNIALHEQLSRREADLHRARAALASAQEDRDRAQRKVGLARRRATCVPRDAIACRNASFQVPSFSIGRFSSL